MYRDAFHRSEETLYTRSPAPSIYSSPRYYHNTELLKELRSISPYENEFMNLGYLDLNIMSRAQHLPEKLQTPLAESKGFLSMQVPPLGSYSSKFKNSSRNG